MSEMQNGRKLFSIVLALSGFLLAGVQTHAQEVHLNMPVPGGMPGRPVMTGITGGSNSVTLTWDGPSGYYQLYQKLGIGGQPWQAVGGPNFGLQATVPASGTNAFFRISGPSSLYAGAVNCSECHESTYSLVATTPHGQAYEALRAVHQQSNPDCLVCHTVGFGLPTGFVNAIATPELAGVQCENCHGPGAKHAANEMDLTVRPRVDIAGQVCGGCHNVAENPTFNQWKSSGHFAVVEDMNPPERINSCGRCHSGTARLALVNGQDPAVAAHNDANVGITCVVCHDPHQNHATYNVLTGQTTVSQLRYPVASTNYFSLSTTAAFQNPPNINVCAQCHNDRGAAWTTTSRPPHHSPQYNVLLGSVGLRSGGFTNVNGVPVEIVLNAAYATNAEPASHGLMISKQCVSCHMEVVTNQNATMPPVASHTFAVTTYNVCLPCHPANPEDMAGFMQDFVTKPRIELLVADLNLWATTKAPAVLQTNYGVLGWEYTTPGELSSGTNGPTTALQSQIPDNIKRARFNLYLVQNDGSFGVHNPFYSITLLDDARAWVQQELNK